MKKFPAGTLQAPRAPARQEPPNPVVDECKPGSERPTLTSSLQSSSYLQNTFNSFQERANNKLTPRICVFITYLVSLLVRIPTVSRNSRKSRSADVNFLIHEEGN